MDSKVKIYLDRAENESVLAEIIYKISEDKKEKERFIIDENMTFYSAVIGHSYYSIFYCTKALLLTEDVETKSPEIHRKTYDEFKKIFVDSGKLDIELLKIYKKMLMRADELLGLFKQEKWKRGHFTYKTISQANMRPAKESVKNAKKFIKHIRLLLKK